MNWRLWTSTLVHDTSTSRFFFFNDTATTEIYTLSLHDALPICSRSSRPSSPGMTWERGRRTSSPRAGQRAARPWSRIDGDRKSTRLNSSHANISYAVFCLKKKKDHTHYLHTRNLFDLPLPAKTT